MSDDWFAWHIAPDGDIEDGCHPQEAQALKEYLRQDTTPTDAAQAITRPIATATNPREHLYRLWGLPIDALLELPQDHTDALLALLQAIQDLPNPASLLNAAHEGVWKHLLGFGNLWSDLYLTYTWCANFPSPSDLNRATFRDEHIRRANVVACLFKADLAGIPLDRGYEVVADALESRNAVLDFGIPAAAEWFVVCGKRFMEGARREERRWALTGSCNGLLRDMWRVSQDDVMDLGRWEFWKERLRKVQKEGVAVGSVGRALVAMVQAEMTV